MNEWMKKTPMFENEWIENQKKLNEFSIKRSNLSEWQKWTESNITEYNKKKTLNDGWRSLPKWYTYIFFSFSHIHTYIDDLKPITSLSFTDLLIFFLALFHSIHLFDRFFLSLSFIHSFIRFVGCHTI